jgi:cbb3-type cytochrome oxidase maturation protein
MNILYFLIPLGMLLIGLAAAFFYWAVKNNQFDDLERQGLSILMDEPPQSDEKGDDDH